MAHANDLKVFEAELSTTQDYLSNYAKELEVAFSTFSSIMHSLTGPGGAIQDAAIVASLATVDALTKETYAQLTELSHRLPGYCGNFQTGIDAIDASTL